ncbi:alkaline phosphatase family protein [Candidatus Dependentiae bacterium]|nr:alkaline phosphatase family protein [Candidatus Dependentiae bacterium]
MGEVNIIIDIGVIINKKRIFVIGIDGGSFRILDQHLNFESSNFSRIKNKSASGILNSTFPLITGPTWSSFKSGMKKLIIQNVPEFVVSILKIFLFVIFYFVFLKLLKSNELEFIT